MSSLAVRTCGSVRTDNMSRQDFSCHNALRKPVLCNLGNVVKVFTSGERIASDHRRSCSLTCLLRLNTRALRPARIADEEVF